MVVLPDSGLHGVDQTSCDRGRVWCFDLPLVIEAACDVKGPWMTCSQSFPSCCALQVPFWPWESAHTVTRFPQQWSDFGSNHRFQYITVHNTGVFEWQRTEASYKVLVVCAILYTVTQLHCLLILYESSLLMCAPLVHGSRGRMDCITYHGRWG